VARACSAAACSSRSARHTGRTWPAPTASRPASAAFQAVSYFGGPVKLADGYQRLRIVGMKAIPAWFGPPDALAQLVGLGLMLGRLGGFVLGHGDKAGHGNT
jgi:hypothetical protein